MDIYLRSQLDLLLPASGRKHMLVQNKLVNVTGNPTYNQECIPPCARRLINAHLWFWMVW